MWRLFAYVVCLVIDICWSIDGIQCGKVGMNLSSDLWKGCGVCFQE